MIAAYKEEYQENIDRSISMEHYRRRKRARKLYFFKQKCCGVLLITIAALLPALIGDGTVSVILFPLGLYLAFTKEKIMQF